MDFRNVIFATHFRNVLCLRPISAFPFYSIFNFNFPSSRDSLQCNCNEIKKKCFSVRLVVADRLRSGHKHCTSIQWRITSFNAILPRTSRCRCRTRTLVLQKPLSKRMHSITTTTSLNWTVFELTLNIGIPLSEVQCKYYNFVRLVKLFSIS